MKTISFYARKKKDGAGASNNKTSYTINNSTINAEDIKGDLNLDGSISANIGSFNQLFVSGFDILRLFGINIGGEEGDETSGVLTLPKLTMTAILDDGTQKNYEIYGSEV